MKMSRRAKRMERHHEQRKRPALNLVSLMDIFTILVFFLLVSSSNVQQLPSKKDVSLPTSIAKKAPRETIIITVSKQTILVQGRQVAQVSQVLDSKDAMIDKLRDELLFQSSKTRFATASDQGQVGKAVTIMGDENISYELLRKILATCREADYTQIAFAAMQKVAAEDNS